MSYGTFQSANSTTMRLPGAAQSVFRAKQAAMGMLVARPMSAARGAGLGGPVGPAQMTSIAGDYAEVDVRLLQRALISAGYPVGNTGADGVPGPATLAAIGMFARSIGAGDVYSVGPGTTGGRVQLAPKAIWAALQSQAAVATDAAGRAAREHVVRASTPSSTGPSAPAVTDSTPINTRSWGWVGVGLAGLAVAGIVGAIIWAK